MAAPAAFPLPFRHPAGYNLQSLHIPSSPLIKQTTSVHTWVTEEDRRAARHGGGVLDACSVQLLHEGLDAALSHTDGKVTISAAMLRGHASMQQQKTTAWLRQYLVTLKVWRDTVPHALLLLRVGGVASQDEQARDDPKSRGTCGQLGLLVGWYSCTTAAADVHLHGQMAMCAWTSNCACCALP